MSQESIPFYICVPFVVILLLIALMPLALPHWWEKNRNKGIVAFVASLPVFLFLVVKFPSELLATFYDYLSFIVLLASLFIISGGILIQGNLKATPLVNTVFLLIGAVIANVIGTTGASMLLIRPMLRTNSERRHTIHIPVFFIFVVSNLGGCLTPLGDPPLFLGYLRGVPFTWTLGLFPEWLTAVGIVLAVFYIWDSIAFKKENYLDLIQDIARKELLTIKGKINLLFLLVVVLAVFGAKTPYRELIMVAATILSLVFTGKQVRSDNQFTFNPIIEVAVLFAGIFVTMVPLLMLLAEKGASLGITEPWQFFWLTGGLSSFLDNAPTYLTFSSLAASVTAAGHAGAQTVAGIDPNLLRAISCGAVFMGANTYIGNGPNFMVKSIAEEQGMKVPHFFQYMLYSGLILIPTFLLITLIFFK
ncbi:UIT6 family transporter [Hydrogenispora ethanolica]|uniref:UIT6 family transporter n=1 Tax=Hydrogenispora ethanolica TaxID=1082276 RepID=A0A4V2QCV9_HYDET|nr:sodium:proton antiporter [Hydrogenispora ethanolica]TCL61917.1 UIT6 family transporter [Hydrogenispora ethanolica]